MRVFVVQRPLIYIDRPRERMESPRYGMLSASPRRPHTYAKQAAHGRAGWHSNFPPFEQPERAHKVAQERVVEGRPWLASRGASSSPRAGGSPRSSPRPHRGTLDNVPLHQIPVQPVATGRFANAAAKNVPQMALDRRWQENLSAAAAARPGKKKETVSRMFEIIDKDRTGTLTHEEVFKSILSLQLKVKPGEIDQLVRSCDTNGDGVIDYDEFRIGIMKLQQSDGMGCAQRIAAQERHACMDDIAHALLELPAQLPYPHAFHISSPPLTSSFLSPRASSHPQHPHPLCTLHAHAALAAQVPRQGLCQPPEAGDGPQA